MPNAAGSTASDSVSGWRRRGRSVTPPRLAAQVLPPQRVGASAQLAGEPLMEIAAAIIESDDLYADAMLLIAVLNPVERGDA